MTKNGEYTVPVRAMICSTVLIKLPFSLNDFYIYYKQEWNPLFNDVYGHYVSGFYGDYLFHSVPYEDKALTHSKPRSSTNSEMRVHSAV